MAASQSRSISFTWDKVNNCLENNETVTGYAVEFGPLGGTTDSIITQDTMRSFSMNGLTPGTNYTFRVAEINSVGIGVYSDVINVATLEDSKWANFFCALLSKHYPYNSSSRYSIQINNTG